MCHKIVIRSNSSIDEESRFELDVLGRVAVGSGEIAGHRRVPRVNRDLEERAGGKARNKAANGWQTKCASQGVGL